MIRSGAIRSGSRTYSDPDQFRTEFLDAKGVLALAGAGPFKARQTFIVLNHLRLMQIEETIPRIAYLSLPPGHVHISFPLNAIVNPVWNGITLHAGDIVFHGRGQGTHERTSSANCWGLISIEATAFSAYAKHVGGMPIGPPPISQILRPPKVTARQLIKLHRNACRLAAKNPGLFSHIEARRALENELLEALILCLIPDDSYENSKAKKQKIMANFEATVQAQIARPLTVPTMCHMIGVAERTLRAYCAESLGMSPNRYLRLRRLNLARAALQNADPISTRVENVAGQYQFREPGRFSVAYRKVFGETPSATLGSAGLKRS